MTTIARSAFAVAFGYVAGTLPSADIVSRLVGDGVDPNRDGSGNPGTANVASILGRRPAAAVFAMDVAKAFGAARIGAIVGGAAVANTASSAAVLGHCFPATRGFRGGKGVAASFGQMLATFPAYLPVDLALASLAARSDFWKRRPILTISASCGLWTALAAVWSRHRLPNPWGPVTSRSTPVAAAVSSAAIIFRFAADATTDRDDAEPADAQPNPA